jgi:hypothetical protein
VEKFANKLIQKKADKNSESEFSSGNTKISLSEDDTKNLNEIPLDKIEDHNKLPQDMSQSVTQSQSIFESPNEQMEVQHRGFRGVSPPGEKQFKSISSERYGKNKKIIIFDIVVN